MIRDAMRSGDRARLGALRLVSAAMTEREIEARGLGRAVSAEDEVAVLRRMAKQRRDSIAAFDGAGRVALADAERAELAVVESFLPARLDEAATRDAVRQAVAEVGAAGPRDLGRVMAALKARHGASLDLGAATPLAKALLAAAAP